MAKQNHVNEQSPSSATSVRCHAEELRSDELVEKHLLSEKNNIYLLHFVVDS